MPDSTSSSARGLSLSAYPINDSVGYLLSRVRSLMTNLVTQRTQTELGITGTQASMLFMLAVGKCSTAAELAREYAIDASAVTRLLDRVEKRGLLSRVRSHEDRRVVRLELTDEGRELAERMPEIFISVLDQLLNGFTPEEVGFLKSMLRRILSNYCGDGGTGNPAGSAQ
ncbi:MarR family winged helix-turn-helix transcriptional regulator [Burkholderia gladioli]|uniref:MarR family protein n=2 Tax=Burkholderia gladioli TaxID=28095 RepID=A0A095EY69_BURGA|nr:MULTISPECIES: MarR family transcriptional regulator [Burkholderia]AEA60449.1 Transcriptional regulator, MarR family protein [Burkholderia gladioli BSR3]AJW99523.1 marR family protein [Burkholderia gladioli]ASD79062.1 MarR family transcriptional regulator [Burkholderia gladioli pv. gladioli]ATF84522.1 MarR family transcriptional regulator [Burkholderia gladioli pv. gladioli]AWY55696.1 MarR family transcriptional regulator [Burkholderia gladioli pv. gladioli]